VNEFSNKTRQSRSICTIVEMHKLWTEKAGRGEFTIKIKIRLRDTGAIAGRSKTRRQSKWKII